MSIDNIEVRPTPSGENQKKPGVLPDTLDEGKILSRREVRDLERAYRMRPPQRDERTTDTQQPKTPEVQIGNDKDDQDDTDVLDTQQQKTSPYPPDEKPQGKGIFADGRFFGDVRNLMKHDPVVRGLMNIGIPAGFVAGFMGGQAIQHEQNAQDRLAAPPSIVAPVTQTPETNHAIMVNPDLVFGPSPTGDVIITAEDMNNEGLKGIIQKSVDSFSPELVKDPALVDFLTAVTTELNKEKGNKFEVGKKYEILDKHDRNLIIMLYLNGDQTYTAKALELLDSYKNPEINATTDKKPAAVTAMINLLKSLRKLSVFAQNKKDTELQPGEYRKENGKIIGNTGDETVIIPIT